MAAGACGLAAAVALSATSGLPWVGHYMPRVLLSWAQAIAGGQSVGGWGAVAASAGVVVLTTIVGWQALKRKEL